MLSKTSAGLRGGCDAYIFFLPFARRRFVSLKLCVLFTASCAASSHRYSLKSSLTSGKASLCGCVCLQRLKFWVFVSQTVFRLFPVLALSQFYPLKTGKYKAFDFTGWLKPSSKLGLIAWGEGGGIHAGALICLIFFVSAWICALCSCLNTHTTYTSYICCWVP